VTVVERGRNWSRGEGGTRREDKERVDSWQDKAAFAAPSQRASSPRSSSVGAIELRSVLDCESQRDNLTDLSRRCRRCS
jgi:hypothetical protein